MSGKTPESETPESDVHVVSLQEFVDGIALHLARRFTSDGGRGVPPEERLDQGMMVHFIAEDGNPSMAPVTPRDVADEVLSHLWGKAGM